MRTANAYLFCAVHPICYPDDMKLTPDSVLLKFNRFSKDMIHRSFPGIDLFQLSPGTVQGWVLSAQVGPYHINAGSFNRVLLYEGTFNPDRLHLGFIFSREHSAMVHAHQYNSGTIDINKDTTFVHEIFPPNMVWANIFADEKTIMKNIRYSKQKLHKNPHLIIEGHRNDLTPLIELVNGCIQMAEGQHDKNNPCNPNNLKHDLHKILYSRFSDDVYKQPFIAGDMFRMQMLRRINKLSVMYKNQPLSLDEICTVVKMKRRTVQKYFHEIYGMGPTEYFRVRRLNGTRSQLMNGASCISDTALQWGFTHFGRFSGSYKKLFGESPKTTIESANAS